MENDIKEILSSILELEKTSAEHRLELLAKFSEQMMNSGELLKGLVHAQDRCGEISTQLSSLSAELVKLIGSKEEHIKKLETKCDQLTNMYQELLKDYKELAKMKGHDTNISLRQNN